MVATKQKLKAIQELYQRNPAMSIAAAAKKLKMSKSYLGKLKLKKLGIKARTKKAAPKYVKDQEQRVKTACRKLYDQMSKKTLVLDDETYVNADPAETPGRKFYHSSDPKLVNYEHKVKNKSKFPTKYLIWQALDDEGNISRPFVSKGTANANVYRDECLCKRLLPFIHRHHEISSVLFWPDLATSHYDKGVTASWTLKSSIMCLRRTILPTCHNCAPSKSFGHYVKKNIPRLRKLQRM